MAVMAHSTGSLMTHTSERLIWSTSAGLKLGRLSSGHPHYGLGPYYRDIRYK